MKLTLPVPDLAETVGLSKTPSPIALSSPGIETVALGLGTAGAGSSDPGRTTRRTTRPTRTTTPATSPRRTAGLASGEAAAGTGAGSACASAVLAARRTVASSEESEPRGAVWLVTGSVAAAGRTGAAEVARLGLGIGAGDQR